MALAEFATIERSETFEPRRLERVRVRLTSIERQLVRYVLCEWSGDAGGGSPWPETQSEEAWKRQQRQLDRQAVDEEVRARVKTTGQPERFVRADLLIERSWRTIYVPKGGSPSKYGAVDLQGYPLLEGAETWSQNQGRRRSRDVVRAWRAITALDREHPAQAVCLMRLYGDSLPGDHRANPYDGAGGWGKDIAAEYALVGDLVLPEPWLRWVDSIAVDAKKREGETPTSLTARVGMARAARAEAIRAAAARAEALIEAATLGYRTRWEAAS